MKAKKEVQPKPGISREQILAGLAILVLLVAVYYISDFALHIPPEFIYTYGLAGVFVLSILGTMTIIIPVPLDFTIFVLSKIYPPELLSLIAGIGSGLGEMTSYILGYLGHRILDHKEFPRVKNNLKKYGGFFIFGICVFPVIPFDIIGLIGGYLRMPFLPFLGAAMAGKTVRYYIISRTGSWFFNNP